MSVHHETPPETTALDAVPLLECSRTGMVKSVFPVHLEGSQQEDNKQQKSEESSIGSKRELLHAKAIDWTTEKAFAGGETRRHGENNR